MAVYITKKDYFDFSGIDLDLELKGSNTDNPSKAVDIFLTRIENWLLQYVEMFFFYDADDFDSAVFKKAILHQIDYLRANGDLSVQGGNRIQTLSPNALMALKMGGMGNQTKKRYEGLWANNGY